MEFLEQIFDLTRSQRVFGQNVVWIFFSFMVSFLFYLRLRTNQLSDDARILVLGIIWVAMGSGLHRLYYTMKRWFEAMYGNEHWMVQWMTNHGDWTLAAAVAVVMGYTFHLSSYLKQALPRTWVVASFFFALALFLLSANWLPA